MTAMWFVVGRLVLLAVAGLFVPVLCNVNGGLALCLALCGLSHAYLKTGQGLFQEGPIRGLRTHRFRTC